MPVNEQAATAVGNNRIIIVSQLRDEAKRGFKSVKHKKLVTLAWLLCLEDSKLPFDPPSVSLVYTLKLARDTRTEPGTGTVLIIYYCWQELVFSYC